MKIEDIKKCVPYIRKTATGPDEVRLTEVKDLIINKRAGEVIEIIGRIVWISFGSIHIIKDAGNLLKKIDKYERGFDMWIRYEKPNSLAYEKGLFVKTAFTGEVIHVS